MAHAALDQFGTPECKVFRNEILSGLYLYESYLIKEYSRVAKASGYAEANRLLLRRKNQFLVHDLNLASDEGELKLFASNAANICIGLETNHTPETAVSTSRKLASRYGFTLNDTHSAKSHMSRLTDRAWWYQKIRTLRNQRLSEIERELGIVRQGYSAYSSDRAVRNGRYGRAKAREFMEKRVLKSHRGEELTLSECAASNHTNPEIRFAELMTRVKGFEEIANESGHTGVFLTITCPSRMHRSHSKYGAFNAKFDGTTPHQANEYLKRVFERIRAYLHRNGVFQYGVSTVEPHHDGTPHWHLLVFVPKHQLKTLIDAYRKYALQDTPNERGAQKQRFKAEIIDPSKGSAAGYVVKYISKSLSGKGVGKDLYGNDAFDSAGRIIQWSRDHRIRQFQTVGGPSIGVWRELRKIRKPFANPALEAARFAADSGDWAGFIRAMGGIGAGRQSQPVRLHYDHRIAMDIESSEVMLLDKNKYGEKAPKLTIGLRFDGKVIPTRKQLWNSQRKLMPLFNVPTKILTKLRSSGSFFAREESEPWTCVNNCTGGITA